MIYLIFPKPFERDLFLLRVCNDRNFIQIHINQIEETILIGIQVKDNHFQHSEVDQRLTDQSNAMTVWFLITVISDSDIGFNHAYGKFLDKVKSVFSDLSGFNFVLCGTCGGTKYNKPTDSFFINKAFKWDRGIIRNNTMVVDWERLLLEIPLCQLDSLNDHFPMAFDLTSNHLMLTDPIYFCKNQMESWVKENNKPLPLLAQELKIAVDKPQDYPLVAEMETHDFFVVSKDKMLPLYACLRIISDVPTPEENPQIYTTITNQLKVIFQERNIPQPELTKYSLAQLQKLCRNSLNMHSLLVLVKRMAIIDIITVSNVMGDPHMKNLPNQIPEKLNRLFCNEIIAMNGVHAITNAKLVQKPLVDKKTDPLCLSFLNALNARVQGVIKGLVEIYNLSANDSLVTSVSPSDKAK